MKNKLLSAVICSLFVAAFFLGLYDINLIKYEKVYEQILTSTVKNTHKNDDPKKYSYYDLLTILKKANSNFIIEKMNKNDAKNNVINFMIRYNGSISEFFESVDYIKEQKIISSIDKINISKGNNNNNIIEMDINLYNYK